MRTKSDRLGGRARKGKMTAAGAAVVLLAAGGIVLVTNREAVSNIPGVGGFFAEPLRCPLNGAEPARPGDAERPGVAVKIENSPAAYPLSGLEDAELVYEELVEGGATRFLAIYHCSDSDKAGPVRSARTVDPAIVTPITRILAFSGANDGVYAALDAAGIVQVDEDVAGEGLTRVDRAGVSFEHTLYASTTAIRKLGRRSWGEPPPPDLFRFGDLEGRARRVSTVSIAFSPSSVVTYEWSDRGWLRVQNGAPFLTEEGDQIAVDNVLIEEHEVGLSDIVDITGTPSPEIIDVTGSGRAVLFRDGRMVRGEWHRESIDAPVVFVTRVGDDMVLAPGSTWIELVPSRSGEVKGSFSFEH